MLTENSYSIAVFPTYLVGKRDVILVTSNLDISGCMSREPHYGYLTVDTFDCPPFIMFDNDDCPACRTIRESRFEPASMRLWCALVRSVTSVLDIGANVGVYSLAAAALRNDIPIHAFEPNPHAYARLRVNKRRNGFSNITEHQEALGHEDGVPVTLSWRANPESRISSGSGLGDHKDSGPIEKSVALLRRFDALKLEGLGQRPAVKIDVEGAEIYVFRGAMSLLDARPDIILESFHQVPCDEITEATSRLGYRYFFINEETGEISEQAALTPASRQGTSFNQFLTTRPLPFT